MVLTSPRTRKREKNRIRTGGGAAQPAAMIDIEAGDEMEFDHIGDGTLRLRKGWV